MITLAEENLQEIEQQLMYWWLDRKPTEAMLRLIAEVRRLHVRCSELETKLLLGRRDIGSEPRISGTSGPR